MTQYPNPYASAPPPYPPRLLCPQCGSELSPALLACPRCQRLVHADRLNQLAAEARAATDAGDLETALNRWQDALPLLPRQSRQHATITARVEELTRRLEENAPRGPAGWRRRAMTGRITGIGSLLLFLLAGLSKASTFWSMLLFAGVYWTVYGWKLALGIVLSIYVHEMGHVARLLRYGVPASAPMFIPGLGALIMLKTHPTDPRQDARIGLAGPTWGLGAALVAFTGWAVFHWPSWAATAQLGAWVNLFNLTPIWQLDGSRGFRSMNTSQRCLALAVIAATYLVISSAMRQWIGFQGMLFLVGGVALLRCVVGPKPERPQGDWPATAQYAILVATLSALSMLHVPGVTDRG